MKLSDLYRRLPHFKGKFRLGKVLFRHSISIQQHTPIRGKRGIQYYILNTHDSIGRDLFFDGEYEPQTIEIIERLMPTGGVMIDAGANIGAISLPVAQKSNTTIWALEPGKRIFEALQKNIALNKTGNVHAVNAALSFENGEAPFYESDRVHGWSGLVKIGSFEVQQTQTVRLDDFCHRQQIAQINVLKLDVQGWEYFVLQGAGDLLDGRIKNIIFEFEWWAEENAGLTPGAAQEFLLEKGYRLQLLNGKKLEKPQRTGTVQLWASKAHVPHTF